MRRPTWFRPKFKEFSIDTKKEAVLCIDFEILTYKTASPPLII